jgi:uncharacterized protein (TIGR03083 family)
MTTTFDAAEVLTAYQGIRERTVDLLRSIAPGQETIIVPSCPAWTVQQLVCHLVGTIDDIVNGRLDGAGSDAWTAAQVERHAGDSVAHLADLFEGTAASFDPVMAVIPAPVNLQIVMDQAAHEHDLRLAIGVFGAQDAPSIPIATAYLLGGLQRVNPQLVEQIRALPIDEFELFRSVTGRRSAAQLRAIGFPVEEFSTFLASSPIAISPVDIVDGSPA